MTPQRVEKDLANSVKYGLDLLKLQRPGQSQAFLFAAPTGPRSPSKCLKNLETKALSKCGGKPLKQWCLAVAPEAVDDVRGCEEGDGLCASRVTSPTSSYLHAGMSAHYEGI